MAKGDSIPELDDCDEPVILANTEEVQAWRQYACAALVARGNVEEAERLADDMVRAEHERRRS